LDPESRDFDILHKEMANPTGLLEEVVMRSIEPFREQFDRVVRDLLGPGAAPHDVQLCRMSIMAQCLWPLMRERHRRRHGSRRRGSDAVPGGLPLEQLAAHIHRFSLAGIRDRKQKGSGRRREAAAKKTT
jgi:hypothetical protein